MKLAILSLSALLGVSAASASGNAAVYELSHENTDPLAPVVSVRNTLLYLADKFGIDDFYSVGQSSGSIELLDTLHKPQSAVGDKPNLLVIVKGVDEPSKLLENHSPSLEVSLGDKKKTARQLIQTLFERFPKQVAKTLNASSVATFSDEVKYVLSDAHEMDKLTHRFKIFNHELPDAWEAMVKPSLKDGARNAGQSVVALQDSGLKLINDKLFINEIMQMIQIRAEEDQQHGEFIAANFDSLVSIGSKIGYDSKTYNVAKRSLIKSIQALSHAFDVTLIAIGPQHELASCKASMEKRSKELANVFATFSKRGAVAAKSCFADKDACQAGTSKCNGHGSCAKVSAKCWQCVCLATVDEKTSKTTKWAGFDCSKKDIAAQAHLLLWTSAALLATLVGGIKLLYSIGDETLPGELLAATVER